MRHIDYYTDIVMGKKGGGGGITPSGTKNIDINQNGVTEEDVTTFEKVRITTAVPEPQGTKEISISQNGDTTENVKDFENAHIVVNVPEAEGNIDITTNGQHDVKKYATANVNVPQTGITPEGTKEIAINSNGQITEDVTQYKDVHITTNVPLPSAEKSVTYTENKTVDEDVSEVGTLHVTVQVPEPSGEKQITIQQNGETVEDIKQYASARINVQVPTGGGGEDRIQELVDIIGGNLKDSEVTNEDITNLSGYNFFNEPNPTVYNLPNVENVGDFAFAFDAEQYTKSQVTEIHLPAATSIGKGCFMGCYKLKTLEIPDVTFMNGSNTFSRCGVLTKLIVPKLETYNLQTFRNNFKPGIKLLDMKGGKQDLDISHLISLTHLVIRKEDGVCPLYSTTSATNIYVPDSLVEEYKGATNWSKYSEYIKPLSEYVEPEV